MSESDSKSGKQIGPRLRAALTDLQLCALLNVAGEAGVLRRLDSELRAADPDLANTVGRILAASESAESPTTALLTRWRTEFRQRRNLWKDMKACGCPAC